MHLGEAEVEGPHQPVVGAFRDRLDIDAKLCCRRRPYDPRDHRLLDHNILVPVNGVGIVEVGLNWAVVVTYEHQWQNDRQDDGNHDQPDDTKLDQLSSLVSIVSDL